MSLLVCPLIMFQRIKLSIAIFADEILNFSVYGVLSTEYILKQLPCRKSCISLSLLYIFMMNDLKQAQRASVQCVQAVKYTKKRASAPRLQVPSLYLLAQVQV